ncbi:MAG: MBL fold metallo-hydrolase [Spirochaetales bacterium]|nr:MBL fold metallo-hydrolase [Spirochaetales bacterium]
MEIKFWGVRGSIPTPITPEQLESKIAAVVQRVKPEDLDSEESRELFISNLPESIINTVGGNTTCVEINLSDGTRIIIDAGTGLRELGRDLMKKREIGREFHIFFTHMHWDHLQGFPFFDPAYLPQNKINFYSPVDKLEEYLNDQMRAPYFPVTMAAMGAKKTFHTVTGDCMRLGNATISWRRVKHPGGCFAYKIEENGRSFIFSTDTELRKKDFEKSKENHDFFYGADILVIDSQYTLDEAIEKYDWGHSSYSQAVEFAATWKIKKLGLFHHEPKYADNKLYSILNSAKWYLSHLDFNDIDVFVTTEGLELEL